MSRRRRERDAKQRSANQVGDQLSSCRVNLISQNRIRRNAIAALIRKTSRELKLAKLTGLSKPETEIIRQRRNRYFELFQSLR